MLVSKAANLNESQIQELANLQRGVAAIYQNEWTEPVLCHIEPHERGLEYSPTQSKHSAKDKVSSEELRYLNSCVLNPFKLDEPREYNFCDCVHKMDIPGMRTESWTLGRPDWSPHVFDGGSAQGR